MQPYGQIFGTAMDFYIQKLKTEKENLEMERIYKEGTLVLVLQ